MVVVMALSGSSPGHGRAMCLVEEKNDQEELFLWPSPYMDKCPNMSHRYIFQVGRGVLQLGNRFLLFLILFKKIFIGV